MSATDTKSINTSSESAPSSGELALAMAALAHKLSIGSFTHKMYIVVNNDLGMGKGKMCGQVGHAVAAWTRRLERNSTPEYRAWLKFCEPKIVLKADQNTLMALHEKYPSMTEIVIDAGKTQIAPGSITAVAFPPLHQDAQPKELANLKLL